MVKKNDIYISTSNFKNKFKNDLQKILNNLPQNYSKFEISSGHNSTLEMFGEILNKKENGYEILLHNYPLKEPNNILINLSEFDDTKRKLSVEYIKKMIDFTNVLDGDYFSIHAGWIINSHESELTKLIKIRNKALDLFIQTLSQVNEYAKNAGVKLGIENHVVEKGNEKKLILYDIFDFEKLFQTINDDNVLLHLDFGHLKISSTTMGFDKIEFINKFIDKIWGVHIHENNGISDTHSMITEKSYFLNSLKGLNNLEYPIIETWNCAEQLENMISIINDLS
jgi:sugar phosphate isomerase/epimerase